MARQADQNSGPNNSQQQAGHETRIGVTLPAQQVTPCLLREYPTRHVLNNELHSRPFINVDSPTRCSHIAVLSGENGARADRDHLATLCRHYNLPAPQSGSNHHIFDFGTFRLKWERHTEFCSYTFLRHGAAQGAGAESFRDTALRVVPEEWLRQIPGEMLVGVHLFLDRAPEDAYQSAGDLEHIFGGNMVAGVRVADASALAWTDFQIHSDGFSRILVNNLNMSASRAGRLVQRLLELETYRMMALLAVPQTRWIAKSTRQIEQQLAESVEHMTLAPEGGNEAEKEQGLLAKLTRLAATVEHMSAESSFRFNASKAYYALVKKRLENIKEEPLEGFQRLSSFLERRLEPAMRTCLAMEDRIAILSRRVNRASTLLQTRINTTLQAQNKQLLESMNRRARVQLRLQQTVEGLSVVAISYYALGIINYLAKGGQEFWPLLNPYVATAGAAPFVIGGVYWGLRRLHRLIRRGDE